MKRLLILPMMLMATTVYGAGWDETVTTPSGDDTVMINDVSAAPGSTSQFSSFKNFPVPLAVQALLDNKVETTGNETIQGIKTFSSSPIVPTPTTDYQAATKEYVDANAGGGGIPEAPSDADAYGRDNGTWTPVLKTADVVTADVDEVTLTKTVEGQTVTLSMKAGGTGPAQVADSLKTNTIQFAYYDASAAELGDAVRIPTSAVWTTAYSRCTVAETALVYELMYHATGGDLVSIGTVAHTSGTLVSQDISALTDPVAGGWFTVNIITPASAATNCTLALDLLGN